MSRESAVAITVGLLVGLLAAAAILFLPERLASLNLKLPVGGDGRENNNLRIDDGSESTISAVPKAPVNELTIDKPENGAVISRSESATPIEGSAPAKSRIVAISPAGEATAVVDANGSFSLRIDLLEGKNPVQIAAYPTELKSESLVKTITLYYTKP